MTERLQPDEDGLAAASAILRAGGLVAYPTDTVYGISCRIGDDAAVARLFEAKRRPIEKRVQWLVASLDHALERGYVADERARVLADACWPGGLTIVLPSSDGGPTQGVRVPDHPVALALIERSGALVTSSANRSGEPETYDADDVAVAFADSDLLDAIVDGGQVPGGVASSVVDLSVDPPRLLREGAIDRSRLEALIGRID
jgi:L-threonylcarbamoyladenylate synthase